MTEAATPPRQSRIEIREKRGISAVWLVPIIALIFGAWLAYKGISERGTFITVKFPSAEGIVVGKTQVMYRGLPAGRVRNIQITEQFDGVLVDIEMLSVTSEHLTDAARFWLVTANVSLSGISGLETLLSGSYIAFSPDLKQVGEPTTDFVALESPPPMSADTPGLHLTLTAPKLGSVQPNSLVTHKQMPVGHVTSYYYDAEAQQVNVEVFIKPEHAKLVRENTRFWNASGIEVSAGLSGVKVATESFASLIAGGIAFDTLPYEMPGETVSSGSVFSLYDDFSDAETSLNIELVLDWNAGIDEGTAIVYQGIEVGEVIDFINIDEKQRKIFVTAQMDPRVEPYLKDQTQFYLVKPSLALSGMPNLSSVLLGTHIAVRPFDQGNLRTSFEVLNSPPPFDFGEPGLHLELLTAQLGSLEKGTGIFYQQMQVGTVQDIRHVGDKGFRVAVHIEPEHQHLVTAQSRFWNTSGVRLKGGLRNFDVQVHSLKSVLAGGIAFDNRAGEQAAEDAGPVINGRAFVLHDNKDKALQTISVRLDAETANELVAGQTRVIYKGSVIGEVHGISFAQEQGTLSSPWACCRNTSRYCVSRRFFGWSSRS